MKLNELPNAVLSQVQKGYETTKNQATNAANCAGRAVHGVAQGVLNVGKAARDTVELCVFITFFPVYFPVVILSLAASDTPIGKEAKKAVDNPVKFLLFTSVATVYEFAIGAPLKMLSKGEFKELASYVTLLPRFCFKAFVFTGRVAAVNVWHRVHG